MIAPNAPFTWGWAHEGFVWRFQALAAQSVRRLPLDFRAPLRSTLNASFFKTELADYPNQQIVDMIEHGVVYQADVELQMVFLPHLT